MKLSYLWIGLISALISMPAMAKKVPFADADFSAFAGDGPATLDGEAFLRLQTGNIKTCAGATVLLAPATEYDIHVAKSLIFNLDQALKQAGPAAKYWRETECDAEGKFSFEDIPVGDWIVITDVSFSVTDPNLVLQNLQRNGGLARQGTEGINAASQRHEGGLVGRKVTVTNKHNRVILTEKNLESASFFGTNWLK